MTYYLATEDEYLTLGDVVLNTPAWTHTNLGDLWSGPPTRGQDIALPSAHGQRPYPRMVDAWRVTLNLAIYGDVDWSGVAYADRRIGLWTNVDHLRANATDPPGGARGTRPLVLRLPDGSTRSASAVVERFIIGSAVNYFSLLATVDIVVPEGRLT